MGWANCGEDSQGRPIGYAHLGDCDHEGCFKHIHRGLAYACGDMHGEDVYSCEGYFCNDHLKYIGIPDEGGFHGIKTLQVCYECYRFLAMDGFLNDDDDVVDPREEYKRETGL